MGYCLVAYAIMWVPELEAMVVTSCNEYYVTRCLVHEAEALVNKFDSCSGWAGYLVADTPITNMADVH